MRILFRLLKSLDRYTWQILLLVVAVFVVTGASLVTPSLIQSAIDDGLTKNNPAALFSVGVTIVAVGLVRASFNFVRRYISERLTNSTAYDFRNRMYDKIQRLAFSYHDQTQTGQLMSRCTEDISALSRFVGGGAVDLLNDTLPSA